MPAMRIRQLSRKWPSLIAQSMPEAGELLGGEIISAVVILLIFGLGIWLGTKGLHWLIDQLIAMIRR